MNALFEVSKLFFIPTKAFHQAFRHSQRAIAAGIEGPHPLVGFNISLFVGVYGLMGIYRWPDLRIPFFLVLAFTGLSCAWQLFPYFKKERAPGTIHSPDWINACLVHHTALSLILDALGIGAMALAGAKTGYWDTTPHLLMLVAAMLAWIPFCRFIFVNLAVLELLKSVVNRRHRFVVFRRFQDASEGVDPGFDQRHRTMVLPALGAFGQLLVVHNETIIATPPGANADSEEIVSQISAAIRFEHADWVYGVSNLIRESDVAVFHWGSYLSPSMLLEFREATRLLASTRQIILSDGDHGAVLELMRIGFPLGAHLFKLTDDEGGLLRQLRQSLLAIARLPDPPPKTQPGNFAWSDYVYHVLWQVAEQGSDDQPAGGAWRSTGVLGEGQCELVFGAGHVYGRGVDAAGWYMIAGHYDDEGTMTGSQQYLGSEVVRFEGQIGKGGKDVHVWRANDVKDVGALTFLAAGRQTAALGEAIGPALR